MKQGLRFTTGQFARLHALPKRTLMYYDDIGLFSPELRGENGYRYYALSQSGRLELILTLRELDVPLDEIRGYLEAPTPQALGDLLGRQRREVDRRIRELRAIQRLLDRQSGLLAAQAGAEPGVVHLVELPAARLTLSRPLAGAEGQAELDIVTRHAEACHTHRWFNHAFGSMIGADKLYAGRFDDYDCYFTEGAGPFTRPAGRYLETCFRGPWEDLPHAYRALLAFAEDRGLTLTGYAYELGLNELTLETMEDYLTQIRIRVE